MSTSLLSPTREKIRDEEDARPTAPPTNTSNDNSKAEKSRRASVDSTSSQSEITAVTPTPVPENEKNEEENFQVGWDGPHDPENPQVRAQH